jgi:hypothetical protein
METLAQAVAFCDGCRQRPFSLYVVDGAKLCDVCSEKSARIDRQLERVRSSDPVSCDGCGDRVDFDARIAVVARECGGRIFCDSCKAAAIARAPLHASIARSTIS